MAEELVVVCVITEEDVVVVVVAVGQVTTTVRVELPTIIGTHVHPLAHPVKLVGVVVAEVMFTQRRIRIVVDVVTVSVGVNTKLYKPQVQDAAKGIGVLSVDTLLCRMFASIT